MYIEGIVSKIKGYTAKLKLPQYDDTETEWLVIPQLFTVNNKTGFKPEIGTLVSAVVTDDFTDGCIIGAIYNNVDVPPQNNDGAEFMEFSDGVKIIHVPNSNEVQIVASKLNIKADIVCDGNIIASGDVSDKKGTVQSIRDWANAHVHTNGNNGANTGTPTSSV